MITLTSLILVGQLLVLRFIEEAWTVNHKMLVKFCMQHEITNALDISENGVMFEKSESADDNSSSNDCDFKRII